MLCDDIQDMDLTNALQGLMSLFTDIVSMMSADITEMLKSKVNNWMASQPLFIQASADYDQCLIHYSLFASFFY